MVPLTSRSPLADSLLDNGERRGAAPLAGRGEGGRAPSRGYARRNRDGASYVGSVEVRAPWYPPDPTPETST